VSIAKAAYVSLTCNYIILLVGYEVLTECFSYVEKPIYNLKQRLVLKCTVYSLYTYMQMISFSCSYALNLESTNRELIMPFIPSSVGLAIVLLEKV